LLTHLDWNYCILEITMKLLQICQTASANSRVFGTLDRSECSEAYLEISCNECKCCSAWGVIDILSKLLAAFSHYIHSYY
jgi:hypothetical protein